MVKLEGTDSDDQQNVPATAPANATEEVAEDDYELATRSIEEVKTVSFKKEDAAVETQEGPIATGVHPTTD